MLINRLKKKGEFASVFNKGKHLRFNSFIIQYAKRLNPNTHTQPRYGIIASKKVGNAVKRNFAKRRIRSLEHVINTLGDKNLDYVLIVKKNIIAKNYNILRLELTNALNKIKETAL